MVMAIYIRMRMILHMFREHINRETIPMQIIRQSWIKG